MTEGSRRAIVGAALALVVLAVAWTGRAAEGRKALGECDSAMARGDIVEAVHFAHIAAEARCPGCAAPDEGLAKLEHIAKSAETRGDIETAFAAWRSARASLLATAVWREASPRRDRAEMEIARLGHRLDAAAAAAGAATTAAAEEKRLRATLAASDPPGGTTYALVGAGGVLFLAAAARFASARRSRTDLGLAAIGAGLGAAGVLLF